MYIHWWTFSLRQELLELFWYPNRLPRRMGLLSSTWLVLRECPYNPCILSNVFERKWHQAFRICPRIHSYNRRMFHPVEFSVLSLSSREFSIWIVCTSTTSCCLRWRSLVCVFGHPFHNQSLQSSFFHVCARIHGIIIRSYHKLYFHQIRHHNHFHHRKWMKNLCRCCFCTRIQCRNIFSANLKDYHKISLYQSVSW